MKRKHRRYQGPEVMHRIAAAPSRSASGPAASPRRAVAAGEDHHARHRSPARCSGEGARNRPHALRHAFQRNRRHFPGGGGSSSFRSGRAGGRCADRGAAPPRRAMHHGVSGAAGVLAQSFCSTGQPNQQPGQPQQQNDVRTWRGRQPSPCPPRARGAVDEFLHCCSAHRGWPAAPACAFLAQIRACGRHDAITSPDATLRP